MRKALITGITGQDGWYLAKLLSEKGYEVVGLKRRSTQETEVPPVRIVSGDIMDSSFIHDLVDYEKPDEFYHLAAMSHVGDSFDIPKVTIETNTLGTLNCLEAVSRTGCRFYQASTSELFGDSPPPQDEDSPMRPRSPYAISKLASYWLVRNYREMGMFAVNGILFNHESPRRGLDFVTQKVCRAAKNREKVVLGNLDASRDWGHAEDYVYGMWLMLQQDKPEDFVLATGQTRTVRQLCEAAYGPSWRDFVSTDQSFLRPLDVESLCGNPAKAERVLGWKRKWTFEAMIGEMCQPS